MARTTLSLIAGLDVHIAGSGECAIDVAFELRPDLILMDEMMPGMGGPTTLERMRTSPLIADIPVIFLSTTVVPIELARLLALGAIGVIGKPLDPLTLADQLHALWSAADAARAITTSRPGDPPSGRHPTQALADAFLARARHEVLCLGDLLERARAGDLTVLKEIERIAHSIHGTAAMFGFPTVSGAGGAIERLVESTTAHAEHAGPIDAPGIIQQLVSHTRCLARAIDAAGTGPPSGEGLFAVRSVTKP